MDNSKFILSKTYMHTINYEYQLFSLNITLAFDEIIDCMFILVRCCFYGKCQNIMH
jgi:hypothetical protein